MASDGQTVACQADVAPARRGSDAGMSVMLIRLPMASAHGQPPILLPVGTDGIPGDPPAHHFLNGAGLLLDFSNDELVLLQYSDAHAVPRDAAGEALRQHACAQAARWRLERQRNSRRLRMPDWLMVYIDALYAASSAPDACRALVACAPLVVGAYSALAYTADTEAGYLRPCQEDRVAESAPDLAPAAAAFTTATIVGELEARGSGVARYAALAPLFDAFATAQLVCAPVTNAVLLVLIERRRDRLFTSEDRDVLGWVVEQARRRMEELDPAQS